MNILVVEDDPVIREGMVAFLSASGDRILEAEDGEQALSLLQEEEIHLVLLDIGLPRMSGLEVLKTLRAHQDLPVLIVSAYNDEASKIAAFSDLADGYIEKPFSLPVLKARIDALLERHYASRAPFVYGPARVDFERFTASYQGQMVELNAKEMAILRCLVDHEGQVLSRMQMIDRVWKESEEIPFDRVIDVYIKELRKKLGLDCIYTIRNVGYKLERS